MWFLKRSTKFPPAEKAAADGLLLVGGTLSIDWLLAAYRAGAFPMPDDSRTIFRTSWYSPDPRAIIPLGQLRKSSRLCRKLRQREYHVSIDQAFADVIAGCAGPRRKETGVWLTPRMQRAYLAMHGAGHAHSIEVWLDGQLIGGTYGVAIGGLFAAESMFSRVSDGSKIALMFLEQTLLERGFQLLDVQWINDHTRSLGATEIPRAEYLQRLRVALDSSASLAPLAPALFRGPSA